MELSDPTTIEHAETAVGVHAAETRVHRTTVLLLHGLCSTPDELRPVHAALTVLGYTSRALCIVGYSFDARAAVQHATPFEDWIAAIERQVDVMRSSHERVVLVGISAGASLALAGAMRCGARVDGLVLLSTTLRFDGWSVSRFHRLLPLALYTPLGRLWKYREKPPYGVKNERIRAWIERDLRSRRISSAGSSVIGIGHLREHDRLRRQVLAGLGEVTCRAVFAMHAREDEIASPSNVELLESRLRCASFRSVLLDDCFHMISIDNSRQQVVRETLGFIGDIASGEL